MAISEEFQLDYYETQEDAAKGNADLFLKADQAQILTDKALSDINADLYIKSKAWMLGVCEASIRSMSSTGQKQTLLAVPNNVDRFYIQEELTRAGYDVQFLNSYSQIKIDWDENTTTTNPSIPSIPDFEDDGTGAE